MKTMILGLCLVAAGCRSGKAPGGTPPVPAWKISFSNPCEPDEESSRPGSVYVTIEKDDPEFGVVRLARIVRVGDPIGGSKHMVYSPKTGRVVEVDFDTKCVLRALTFEKKVAYTYERCLLAAGPAGMACAGKGPFEDFFTTTEILYTDAAGKAVPVHIGGVRKADQLCPDHGGAR